MSKYKCGLIIGRFQVLHNGHITMFKQALDLCEHLLILVGSSQEHHTYKNPFTYEERREWLEEYFMNDDRVTIAPIPDRGLGNNESWGDYVVNYIKENNLPMPDVSITGSESRRESWFKDIQTIQLYKSFKVSSTEVKEMLLNDKNIYWVVPDCVYEDRAMIKERLKEVENNKETVSI